MPIGIRMHGRTYIQIIHNGERGSANLKPCILRQQATEPSMSELFSLSEQRQRWTRSASDEPSMPFRLAHSRTSRIPHFRSRVLYIRELRIRCAYVASAFRRKQRYMLRLGTTRSCSEAIEDGWLIEYGAVGEAGWAIDCGSCPTISIALRLSMYYDEVEESGWTARGLLGKLSKCFRRSWTWFADGNTWWTCSSQGRWSCEGIRASLRLRILSSSRGGWRNGKATRLLQLTLMGRSFGPGMGWSST